MTTLIILVFISYLIGSFPTAFVILKKKRGIDIRHHGTGNVGAMNSLEVTGSKLIGVVIMLVDFAKGLGALLIGQYFLQASSIGIGLCVFFVVAGHVLSPWIHFRGGRGLATAAGAFAVVAPFVLATWLVAWFVTYGIRRNITAANVVALFVVFVFGLLSSTWWMWPANNAADWQWYSSVLIVCPTMILMLLAHLRGPLKKEDAAS